MVKVAYEDIVVVDLFETRAHHVRQLTLEFETTMANAFVVKTASPENASYVQSGVYECLQKGEARIGWSWLDNQDLRLIVTEMREGRWASLTKEQGDAWRCHGFLDRVMPEDYLVYPHQPEYGKFTLVRVVGDYEYASGGSRMSIKASSPSNHNWTFTRSPGLR
jgi:hypothetical protein